MKSTYGIIKVIISLTILIQSGLIGRNCDASKKYNRYLAHIFNKYGNGGALSFEGLEHLMHNLGLGGLEFNLTHTIEEHHPDGYKIPDLELEENNIFIKDSKTDDSPPDDFTTASSQFRNDKYNENIPKERNLDIDVNNLMDLGLIQPTSPETETETETKNFKEMHDPKHRHPRHHRNDNGMSANKCLSPKSLMKLVIDHDDLHRQRIDYRINPLKEHSVTKRYAQADSSENHDEEEEYNEFISSVRISPSTFMKLCPALLVQIDQDACAQRIMGEEHDVNPTGFAYSWIYATIAIFIISCCGLIGIAVVPLIKSAAYNEILKFLVAVAIGTLCGDALMHLLPHALINEHQNEPTDEEASSGHSNEPVWLCSCAFLTALFMYTLETLLPLLKDSDSSDHHHNHGHSHHNHVAQVMPQNSNSIDMEIVRNSVNADAKEINIMLNEVKEDKKGTKLSPVAFMVVLGDGLHNLTDGLAIGAAFANDPVTGMATAFAVLCHELPHELGDFALLLHTGLNIKRAIFLNIISSLLSFMGMAIGLCVAGIHSDMVRWIYAGTAGSFLYIALADLIPEMGRNGETNFKNSIIQIIGILLGGVIMILIALNEDNLRVLFE